LYSVDYTSFTRGTGTEGADVLHAIAPPAKLTAAQRQRYGGRADDARGRILAGPVLPSSVPAP